MTLRHVVGTHGTDCTGCVFDRRSKGCGKSRLYLPMAVATQSCSGQYTRHIFASDVPDMSKRCDQALVGCERHIAVKRDVALMRRMLTKEVR